jgi:hypothetical protein
MQKIIFSITAHESVECLHDLIASIKKAFVHYDICILLSLTQWLNDGFKNTYEYVKVVTVRDDNLPIWGNLNLFQQHILNMEYLFTNNIEYDFFWFVCSNEMFIKVVPEDYMDHYALKICDNKPQPSDQEYETYYNQFFTSQHSWMWIEYMKKDEHMMNYLRENKFTLHSMGHEGLVLPCHFVSEIYAEYTKNELYAKSTFKGYVMEEIFVATYIRNKYNIINLEENCFLYVYKNGCGHNADYDTIMRNLGERHVSIKPVVRRYDDALRTAVRKLL